MKPQLLYFREMSALRPRLTKTAFWNAVKSYVKDNGYFPPSMEDGLFDWPQGGPKDAVKFSDLNWPTGRYGSECDELEDATWADVYAYVYRKEAN